MIGGRSVFWFVCLLVASAWAHGCAPAMAPSSAVDAPISEASRLFETGKAYASAGENVKAEHYFNAARSAGYPRQAVLPELLRVCLTASRLRSALNYVIADLDERQDDAELRTLAGSLYLGLGQPEPARAQLRQSLELNPAGPQALFLLGNAAWYDFGDAAEARGAFERYLALVPAGKHSREVRRWLGEHPVPRRRLVAPAASASGPRAPAAVDSAKPAVRTVPRQAVAASPSEGAAK